MPNDVRPIVERTRDIEGHVQDANQKQGMGQSSRRARQPEDKPFVTDRDTGDEEELGNAAKQ
jgi:hypothetical protein